MCIKPSNQRTDTKGPDTTLLRILLFGLGNMLGDIFNWWVVIIVQSIRLALNPSLIGEDPTIGCETRKCHVNMFIELDDLLDGSSFLEFSDGFFLIYEKMSTSTANITDELVTRPTEHNPFLTA